jgi:hypothetical protein
MSSNRLVLSDFPRGSTLWPKLLPVHLGVKVNVTELKRKMQRLYKNRRLNVQNFTSLDLV